MSAAKPAFVAAALLQARYPGTPLDVEACVGAAQICASDDITGKIADADAFAISLWAQLARRGFLATDFRLRGLRWEAYLGLGAGWWLVSDLLDSKAHEKDGGLAYLVIKVPGESSCPA